MPANLSQNPVSLHHCDLLNRARAGWRSFRQEGFRKWNISRNSKRELSSWQDVSTHPHRFGGREFRFKVAEIGHIHTGGTVDIPFPRTVRDALLTKVWLKSTAGSRIQA